MFQELVPHSYTFSDLEMLAPPQELIHIEPGMFHGVHFTMPAEQLEWFKAKIEAWFEDNDEVIMVAHGITAKRGLGYIALEWEECEINPLFLSILDNEEMVNDYALYVRQAEV